MTEPGRVPSCKITTPHAHSSHDDPIDCEWRTVQEWVEDTYTPEGQAIWLASYEKANGARREFMRWIAQGDGMGS